MSENVEFSLADVKGDVEKAIEELEKLVVGLGKAAEYLPQVLAVLRVLRSAI